MKIGKWIAVLAGSGLLKLSVGLAAGPGPEDGGTNSWVPPLARWTFEDTATWTNNHGHAPISFTNLSSSLLGDGTALVLDCSEPSWIQYQCNEEDGSTNLTVENGSLMFWFAPNWASTNQDGGTGPGTWGRLIEVGSYTEDASYGWLSLFTDPNGANLYFSAQDATGCQTNYLSAPISWVFNRFHHIALTYSSDISSNTALYLDGVLVTNGPPMICLPGPDVLTNGFFIGSDSSGLAQAHGFIDDLSTYAQPLGASQIASAVGISSGIYWNNPYNRANISAAPSSPSTNATNPNVITGSGSLQWLSNTLTCLSSTNVWLTNLVAVLETNGTVDLTFSLQGGSNRVPYDVFAASAITSNRLTAWPFVWMGQAYQCKTYRLSGLPATGAFLVLGGPVDTDQDGLTDAYELLVSHTSTTNRFSNLDGISDGWEILLGLNPKISNLTEPGQRATYSYDLTDWLKQVSGIKSGAVSLDNEGNVLQVSQ